jgi:hypothetical protein
MRPRSRYPNMPSPAERGPRRAPASHALAPLAVRFIEQTDTEYAVGELRGPRTARVPKRRAVADPFLSPSRQGMPGRGLLRWSGLALLGVALAGIGGVVLGAVVVVVALLRLAHFSRKVRRWRRAQRARGERSKLPAAATAERFCLLAALGQGFVAMVAGALVALLLAGFL